MRTIDGDTLKIALDTFATLVGFGGVYDRGQVMECIDAAPTIGGWISVKDKLPESDNEVITAYKIDDEKAMKKRKGKLFVKTGNWTGYRWISVWDEYKSFATEEEVLYWMPLPEPPKEKSCNDNG